MIEKMLEKIKEEILLIFSTKAQSQNGTRQTYLDMARGVAIILVVMGHRGFISSRTNTWISSFHLPLFFIVSGIILAIKNEQVLEIKQFIIKKIKSLLIPYFLFSFCSMALDFHFIPSGPENLIPDFKLHLLQTFTLQGYSVMWFLPVTFFGELLVFLLFSYQKNKSSIITAATIATSILGCLIYNILPIEYGSVPSIILKIVVKSIIAAAFMCIGMEFYKISKYLDGKVKSPVQLLIGIVLFAINIPAAWFIVLKDLNNLVLGFVSVYFILGITGGCGLILICKNIINIAPLTYFGRNSLIVFCTHLNCYVLYYGTIFYQHFEKRNQLPLIINETITANVFSLLFTFILEVPVIMAINILFPFMLGKWYKNIFNKNK